MGYGGRLRHLHRTKRIHLSYLGETFDPENPQATLLKVETANQKGDLLTKEMERTRFEECKKMIQLIPATCSLTARPRTLICSNGICAMPSVALANLLQPPQQEFKAGIDAFIVDSGSGQHLIRRSMVASDSHLTTCPVGILLQTANG